MIHRLRFSGRLQQKDSRLLTWLGDRTVQKVKSVLALKHKLNMWIKDHTELQNNLEVSHAAMLQLSQSYMCSLFSALIGSSSGMGAGQAGLGLVLLCAPIIFSTGSLVLSNYLWSISTFALVVCRREYFETRCRGTLCRGFLCTSNFREQLLLQMPRSSQVVSSLSLSSVICGLPHIS